MNSMSEWETWVRLVNIVLSSICLVLLLRKAFKYWRHYQSRTKDVWWVLFFTSLAVLLGTSEVLFEWGTQYRVLFTLLAMVLTVKVMLRPNEISNPTFTKEL